MRATTLTPGPVMSSSNSALQRVLRAFAVGFLLVFAGMTVLGAASAFDADSVAMAQTDEAATDEAATDDGAVEAAPDEPSPEEAVAAATTPDELDSTMAQRGMSLLGLFGFIGIAWLLSNNRRSVDWRLVAVGTGLQLAIAAFIFVTPFGEPFFRFVKDVFVKLLDFTFAGSRLLFGFDGQLIQYFAFGVLPTIIFFSSLMAIAYHLGIMQRIVQVVAVAMQKTLRTSGSETLSAAANIFVGQTEAPLMIRPYVATMTQSELMAVMTGGFATVAGGVMASYISMLSASFPDIAGHLLAASVMSAPAALVVAKIMFPETEESPTRGGVKMEIDSDDTNLIDAAARGAGEGLTLALNVGAMLLAFVALVAMINYLVALPSYIQHGGALQATVDAIADADLTVPDELRATCEPEFETAPGTEVYVAPEARADCIVALQAAAWPEGGAPEISVWRVWSLEGIFGILFFPIALLMGVPWSDCYLVGQLLGEKMVINEWVAYDHLGRMIADPEITLHPRSIAIASYALCGFANFGSIAIQIGGIGGIAPNRRHDLARLGLRAMIAGSIAAFMTATIAGMLL